MFSLSLFLVKNQLSICLLSNRFVSLFTRIRLYLYCGERNFESQTAEIPCVNYDSLFFFSSDAMEYVKKVGQSLVIACQQSLIPSFFHLLFAKFNISSINEYLSCRFQPLILRRNCFCKNSAAYFSSCNYCGDLDFRNARQIGIEELFLREFTRPGNQMLFKKKRESKQTRKQTDKQKTNK